MLYAILTTLFIVFGTMTIFGILAELKDGSNR